MISANDTIVAISTAPGNGAIGIIRLSGPESLAILTKVWDGKPSVGAFQPKTIYLGNIRDLTSEAPLDEAIVFWMKSPASYTGEDLVEVQAHGGQRLLEILLQNFVAAGARPADPGEFTRRAFLNGRIDLIQAEAVADLINASGTRAIREAERQLEGRLSDTVRLLRNELKVLRAQMEAMIDFPEDEDVQGLHYDEAKERIGLIQSRISSLISTYEEGRSIREGVKIAIVGKPNVGKSSLFNALLNDDRAIVHSTPGTTRDFLEESLDLKGLSVRFIDTAGIRESKDVLEGEGIRRSLERLSKADLILAVFDGSQPLNHEDHTVLEMVKGISSFYLMNKMDLLQGDGWPEGNFLEREAKRVGDKKFPEGTGPVFGISAKNGEGIRGLKDRIFSHVVKHPDRAQGSDLIVTNLRHRVGLQKGLDALEDASKGCDEKRTLELLVTDLTSAMNALGEITGEVTNDEILGEIFSRFCIGK